MAESSASSPEANLMDRTVIEDGEVYWEMSKLPAQSMDSIQISGIRCYGYTGYLPEENVLGQWFEVDLELWADLSLPGSSDRIEDTIDYVPAVQGIKELVKTQKFALIEALAEAISALLLKETQAERVRVKLTKCSPPIPDFGGSIAINIVRP